MKFSLNNFEDKIDEIIVDRGLSYWQDGNVEHLEEVVNGEYIATVIGSEDYDININVEKGEVVEYSCTCPYDRGPVCKHVVAVLFKIRDGEPGIIESRQESAAVSDQETTENSTNKIFDKILKQQNKEELSSWISERAKKDTFFRDSFIEFFSEKNKEINIEKYARIFRNDLDSAADRYGYIDYYHTEVSVSDASDRLNEASNDFENLGVVELFSLCFAVIQEVAPELKYTDDSDGDLGGCIEHSIELLSKVVAEKNIDDKLKNTLFDLCLEYFDTEGMDFDSWDVAILKIAGDVAISDNQKKQLFAELDKKDARAGYRFTNESTAMIRKEVIERLDGAEAAEKYIETVMHLPNIRKMTVEKMISEKKYKEAKNLCYKGLEIDKQWAGLIIDWYEYLLKIAKEENDIAEILKLSRMLFLDASNPHEFYCILKKYTPAEQWTETVESLLLQLENKNQEYSKNWIYIQEGMTDRLLAYVKANPSTYTINEFEKHLKKDYKPELILLYESAIRRDVQRASKRKDYSECCGTLRRMQKLGATKKVEELVFEFSATYKKRPAFLDELKKVWFPHG